MGWGNHSSVSCPCKLGWWKPGLWTSSLTPYPVDHGTLSIAPSQLINPLPCPWNCSYKSASPSAYSCTARSSISAQKDRGRMKSRVVGISFLTAYFCCQGERKDRLTSHGSWQSPREAILCWPALTMCCRTRTGQDPQGKPAADCRRASERLKHSHHFTLTSLQPVPPARAPLNN